MEKIFDETTMESLSKTRKPFKMGNLKDSDKFYNVVKDLKFSNVKVNKNYFKN